MADSTDAAASTAVGANTGANANAGAASAGASAPDSKRPKMAVKVYAPFQVYYDGEAYSVSGRNESGPFDILPQHHNFICMLMPCDLEVQTAFDVKVIKISRALMHVKANRVVVFVDV